MAASRSMATPHRPAIHSREQLAAHNFIALGAVLSYSLNSIGIKLPISLSATLVICLSLSVLALVYIRTIRINNVILALIAFFALITVSLLVTLDHGAQLLSYTRGATWFFIFLVYLTAAAAKTRKRRTSAFTLRREVGAPSSNRRSDPLRVFLRIINPFASKASAITILRRYRCTKPA